MTIKRSVIAGSMAVAISLSGLGYAMAFPTNATDKTTQQLQAAVTEHDTNRLKIHSIILNKPTQPAAISTEKAIEIASNYAVGFAKEAKSIVAEYQLITNTSLNLFSEAAKEKNPKLKNDGYLNVTPVYIVSFKGVNGRGRAAHGKQAATYTELNVVVDANSGELLFSFNYR